MDTSNLKEPPTCLPRGQHFKGRDRVGFLQPWLERWPTEDGVETFNKHRKPETASGFSGWTICEEVVKWPARSLLQVRRELMAAWKSIVGESYSVADFETYCQSLQWIAWRPSFVVLHNTANPSLKQRPKGLTKQHILNLEVYYRDTKHWSAGPHLFVDDRQIWVFTPLTVSGIHSPSWNKVALGVEMLGDYEKEAFDTGRGLQVRERAVAAIATLHGTLGIDPATLRLHREDPLTTHACPGKNVRKLEMIQAVQDLLLKTHAGEHTPH